MALHLVLLVVNNTAALTCSVLFVLVLTVLLSVCTRHFKLKVTTINPEAAALTCSVLVVLMLTVSLSTTGVSS
jgi:hypothetical protein